ncbi:MAG: TIM barrel protein, partial [Planctomycetes bacterium]|nr:TIM barrel protein [Planctomycetota bacterium]
AGYHDRDPSRVKATLDALGLKAPSAHVPFSVLLDGWDRVLEAGTTVGHSYLICPSLPGRVRGSLDGFREVAEIFNRAGERARAAGIRFGYHNHDFEFSPVDGRIPYDMLIAETDPQFVTFQLDLFWITKARRNPLSYFARYPGRFSSVHVKDMDGTSDCIDGCPNDADKDSPGDCGCGAVDEDLDEDGISDCIDNCPVDANADQSDADGDGVGDACDSAPSGGGGGSAPAGQQVDDDPTLEDDSSDAVESEESEPDGDDEEVDAELTEQAVQESEEDAPSGLPEEADEREDAADADDDDDGVQNQFDECPNTARAARVDATGCVADVTSEDGSEDGLSVLAPPATNDFDDESSAGVCGQGLGLLELSCMLSFAAMFGASGRRRNRRVLSVLQR